MSKILGTSRQKMTFWLLELPTAKLILLAWIGTYATVLPVLLYSFILESGKNVGGPNMGKHDIVKMIVLGCVAAPLIETAVNQWLCLRILKKLRCRAGVAIAISALLFGVAHNYSGASILFASFAGAILATVFVIEDARDGRPFLATWAVHLLRNATSTAIALFML